MKTIYTCMGSCKGISPKPKNCGAKTCENYGKPLVEVEQCEKCGKIASFEKVHRC